MFKDDVPEGADAILLSNVLHDWDVPDCVTLVSRCASAIRTKASRSAVASLASMAMPALPPVTLSACTS